MALVIPSILGDGMLRLDAPGMPPLADAAGSRPGGKDRGDRVERRLRAVWVGERAAEWFTEFLGTPCSLVHMADDVVRPANPAFAPRVRG